MAVDWTNTKLNHKLLVQMVDPRDHDAVLGELECDLDGNKVIWGNETDTKVSASISVTNWDTYIENSWIRLIHRIEEENYERVLFTGFVWDDSAEYRNNEFGAAPSLMSSLKALELDRLTAPITIGEGALSQDIVKTILNKSDQKYTIASDAGNYRYSETSVMDAGDTRLECMLAICEVAGYEMHVNGSGIIKVSKYIYPGYITPKFTLDSNASNTVVLSSGLSRTGNKYQVAGRSIAVYKHDEEVIVGYADVSSKHLASPKRRGYTIAEVHELHDLTEPVTQAQVQQLAKDYLTEDSTPFVEWNVATMWLPLEEGDTVVFIPPNGEPRTCLCKTVEADLHSWTLNLTLKEVA